MKILYITPNHFDNSGGGIYAHNIYNALKQENLNVYIYSPNNLGIKAIKNKRNDILSRILGHSNFMYMDWKRNKNKIIDEEYDAIFLSNSRLGFIAEDLKKGGYKGDIIAHFDNIEYDYCDEYAKQYNKFKAKIFKMIEKKNVFKDEKRLIEFSDKLIFLTKRDSIRAKRLYNYQQKIKEFIIPICMENNNEKLKSVDDKLNFIFIGSLWYGPNVEAITWFVDNIWTVYYGKRTDIKLIIAGSRPVDEIIKYNSIENIQVHANFNCVGDIIPQKGIFISPIINGAGMKVKIAEALQLGLPIIATKESLVGYDEVKNFKFIVEANSVDQYVAAMNEFLSNSKFDSEEIKEEFNKYYSLDRLRRDLLKVFE